MNALISLKKCSEIIEHVYMRCLCHKEKAGNTYRIIKVQKALDFENALVLF